MTHYVCGVCSLFDGDWWVRVKLRCREFPLYFLSLIIFLPLIVSPGRAVTNGRDQPGPWHYQGTMAGYYFTSRNTHSSLTQKYRVFKAKYKSDGATPSPLLSSPLKDIACIHIHPCLQSSQCGHNMSRSEANSNYDQITAEIYFWIAWCVAVPG